MSSAAQFELLMNTEFVQRLRDGIASAQDRVLIQVMTFDGDVAGLGVADLMIDAVGRGVDVQLTVDSFAFRYVSDTKHTDPLVTEEVAATHAMFDRMEAAGVSVTYVNPFGSILQWGAFRNHKKVFVLDDNAYIGGINISDHNFEWLDFNIGIDDPALLEILVDDYAKTRRGEKQSLDGPIITNERVEATFLGLIEDARESIVVASPYALDALLVNRLAKVTAPNKTVIAPRRNNFATFRRTDPYIRKRLRNAGVMLQSYVGFFHAKFVLVDGTKLMVGSSNFGLHSFRCNQEIAVVIEDPEFIRAFTNALEATEELTETTSPLQYAVGAVAAFILNNGTLLVQKVFARHAPTITTR